MSRHQFLFDIPFIIFKFDLFVLIDGGMNIIHIVVDAFIHGLNPPLDIDLPLELFRLMLTGKAFDLFNQLA